MKILIEPTSRITLVFEPWGETFDVFPSTVLRFQVKPSSVGIELGYADRTLVVFVGSSGTVELEGHEISEGTRKSLRVPVPGIPAGTSVRGFLDHLGVRASRDDLATASLEFGGENRRLAVGESIEIPDLRLTSEAE